MKKYNAKFKSMVVGLYKTGRSVKELSREYGVSESLSINELNKFLLLPQSMILISLLRRLSA